jgi:hypothetical protein
MHFVTIRGGGRRGNIQAGEGNSVTVERTILLVVGTIILVSVVLSVYQGAAWLWLAGILGAHLVQASFTGLCPVVAVLKRLGLPTKAGFS